MAPQAKTPPAALGVAAPGGAEVESDAGNKQVLLGAAPGGTAPGGAGAGACIFSDTRLCVAAALGGVL